MIVQCALIQTLLELKVEAGGYGAIQQRATRHDTSEVAERLRSLEVRIGSFTGNHN
jgi:hypothetical protein